MEVMDSINEPAILDPEQLARAAEPVYSGFVNSKQESTYLKFIGKLIQILSKEMLKFKLASEITIGKF